MNSYWPQLHSALLDTEHYCCENELCSSYNLTPFLVLPAETGRHIGITSPTVYLYICLSANHTFIYWPALTVDTCVPLGHSCFLFQVECAVNWLLTRAKWKWRCLVSLTYLCGFSALCLGWSPFVCKSIPLSILLRYLAVGVVVATKQKLCLLFRAMQA